ncbi:kinase-like domain-containing protein, partial [Dichotomocladium elegans]
LPPGTIVHEHIQILKTIGHGAYGKVYLGYDRRTKKRYAIKAFLQDQDDSNDAAIARYQHQRYIQRNEMILHAKLRHPNIIRLEHLVKQGQYIHMVLEHSSEGDLFSAITDKNYYYGNHALIRQVYLQLIDAVKYCHDHGVYHRDLKPENILVFDRGRTLKIADFGLATAEPIAKDFGCGSTYYFSPECQGDDVNLANGYATAPNDVWALGVILLNLATGRNPWRQACLADETFRSYLSNRDHLYDVLPISRELNGIVKRIFCIDPARRIGLSELRESILGCKYFTRTIQVERVEKEGHPNVRSSKYNLQSIFPPSPPTMPN